MAKETESALWKKLQGEDLTIDEKNFAAKEGSVYSGLSQGLSNMLSPDWNSDTSEFDKKNIASSTLAGLGTGISVAAVTTGPVGIGAGLIMMAGTALLNKSKRKKAKAEYERRRREIWENKLLQYKKGISIKQDQLNQIVDSKETALSKQDVSAVYDKASQMQTQIEMQERTATGVKRIGTEVDAIDKGASVAQIMQQESESLLFQIEQVTEVNELLEKEKNASREVGEIKTSFVAEAEKKLKDLEERF